MIFNDKKNSKQNNKEDLGKEVNHKYLQDSQDEKPVHFKVEYDKNKNIENKNDNPEGSDKKELNKIKNDKDFNIEKNNELKEDINPEYFQENEKSNNSENNQLYNILGENYTKSNKNMNNLNDYYYYYLNNNNLIKNNDEEEYESKKVTNFATQVYQGRIDPVKLNRKYKNYWDKNFNNKKKYNQKYEELKKVFQPYGYKNVINNLKKKD